MSMLRSGIPAALVTLFSGFVARGQTLDLIAPAEGNQNAYVAGLSDDGRFVAGLSGGPSRRAVGFRWSGAAGREDFGLLAGMPLDSYVFGISNDGSAVVGMGYDGGRGSWGRGGMAAIFRDGQAINLGILPGATSSRAFDANHDASVVVGYAEQNGFTRAFRWTEAEGMVHLGFARPGDFFGRAVAVSRAGDVVVGASGGSSNEIGFVWTPQSGMRALPDILPSAMNSTGSVLVGLWHGAVMLRDGERVEMGPYNGEPLAFAANGVDEIGSVVVGRVNIAQGELAAVWTEAHGVELLGDYFGRFGVVLLPDFVLSNCAAVSSDGLTFTGFGRLGPGVNNSRGFVVTVPTPGVGCLGTAIAMFSSRRTRRVT
ncbi:MAG: hypothetical protein HEQ23_05940 [Tepidisphaera sp.]